MSRSVASLLTVLGAALGAAVAGVGIAQSMPVMVVLGVAIAVLGIALLVGQRMKG